MAFEIRLDGKNALITGAGAGLGRAVAEILAEAGANVMIADINMDTAEKAAEEIAEKFGVETLACRCDVTSKTEVDAMVGMMLEKFGRIDILNHIAGIAIKADFLEITEELFDKHMNINAKGTFLVNQAVLRAMIPNHAGKIVNMSSQAGKVGSLVNTAYSAAKFAVTGMTQSIAKYAAPHNINVNCVCPGIIMTNIWKGYLEDIRKAGGDADAYWESRISEFPLKRPQTVEDVARMCLYLSSDCADNITGQSINVSGGNVLL